VVTVLISKNDEPKVYEYTKILLEKESFPLGSSVALVDNWAQGLEDCKTEYVCFVEPDCLVSSGYFSSLAGLVKSNPKYTKLAMLSSATAVKYWPNRFFGYEYDGCKLAPVKNKKSNSFYRVRVGYAPGALIRTSIIKEVVKKNKNILDDFDLVKMSVGLSLAFWSRGDGCPVYVNPITTYVTNCEDVGVDNEIKREFADLVKMFERELI
jgi:hypothetical protein